MLDLIERDSVLSTSQVLLIDFFMLLMLMNTSNKVLSILALNPELPIQIIFGYISKSLKVI